MREVRRSRGTRIVSAFILLACMANLPSASAASLAGKTCPKAGTVKTLAGIKYVCTKSGRSAIWKKKPTAQTQKPATPNPTIQDRWNATGSNALKVFNANIATPVSGAPTSKLEFVFSPTLWKETGEEVRRKANAAAAFWDSYYSLKKPVYFTIGTYEDAGWLCAQLLKQDPNRIQPNCEEKNLQEMVGSEDVGHGYFLTNGQFSNTFLFKNSSRVYSTDLFTRFSGTWMYALQWDLGGGPEWGKNVPCWFYKTGAQYLGLLGATAGDSGAFLHYRAGNFTGSQAPFDTFTAADFAASVREKSVMRNGPHGEENCEKWVETSSTSGMYHYDQAALEWLIDRVGIKGYVELIEKAKTTPWSKALTDTVGLSEDEIYKQMGEYTYREVRLIVANPWIRQ